METEQKLMPCPLCTGEAAFAQNHVDFEPVWAVRCVRCDLCLDVRADSKEEAAAMWNNRPAPVSTDGLVKRLRGWALDEESSASNLEGDFEPTDMNAELYKSVVKERREKAKQMLADANLLAALTPGKES